MKLKKKLSIEELKKCKGFENYSDEQAEETINTLETLSILFYEWYMKQKLTEQKLKLLKRDEDEEQRNAA